MNRTTPSLIGICQICEQSRPLHRLELEAPRGQPARPYRICADCLAFALEEKGWYSKALSTRRPIEVQ